MAAFATLMAKLGLDTAEFNKKLADATEKMSKASEKMSKFATTTNESYGRATAALKSHNLGLKDTARIVQGIMVSQIFYGITQNISGATSALWDFNVALDYAKVTYSALFGDTKIASDFMDALQEHSINTIFDYQGLADSSKKLLAYGIDYKNLMFIIEGLTNLGTMSGDSAALDRIALALGQIYTKGKLSAEEMRQLANAYIPITDILKDKFGLTGDDLKRVGDLNLPAADVINAIVDYANENFSSVGDAAMYTITGLQNKIVDTLKVVGTEMLGPITTAYKSFLAYISNGLAIIREEYASGGIGGIFEHLVPNPDKQQLIRQFLANLHNLFTTLASVGVVVGQVLGNIASVFMTAFNIVSPLILGVINLLSAFLNALLSTRVGATLLRIALLGAAAAFVVLKVQAAGALIVTAVTKAVNMLSKALLLLSAIITKHPILSLIAALAVGLVGVSTASNAANKGISGLFDKLSGVGGASSDDIFKRTEQGLQDSASEADQFNNRLGEGAEAADKLADGVGGVGKAAKDTVNKLHGLLSFDEVFKLQDPNKGSGGSGSGSGIGGAIDDYAGLIGDIGGLSDVLIPDIPDFSEYVSDFTDNLFGGIWQGITDKLAGSPGWLIGGLAGLGSVLSKSFTKLFGTSIGEAIKSAFKGGSIKGIFKAIGDAIKGAGLKSILKGGVIGAAIGMVVDGLASTLWGRLSERFDNADTETAAVGQTIGSVLGAVVGGIFGGPAGALIGSAIGTFAGGFVGLFWEPIKDFFVDTGVQFSTWMANTISGFVTWWADSLLGFLGWSSDTIAALSTWWSDTTTGFSDWWNNTWTGLSTWWSDTITGFSDWWSETWSGFSDWWDETTALFTDWDKFTFEALSNWWSDTLAGLDEWAGETLLLFVGWVADTFGSVAGWCTDTLTEITTWIDETLGGFAQWAFNALLSFGQWAGDALNTIAGWAVDALGEFTGWAAEVLGALGGWALDFVGELFSWAGDALEPISTWASDALGAIGQWFIDIGKKFADGLRDIGTAISDFFTLDNLWSLMSNGLNGVLTKLGNWWGDVVDFWSGEANVNASVSSGRSNGGASFAGHANGGVFDREHIARFAEGNKREAIIPLENPGAMKPFVDAVSGGLISTLAPVLASANSAPNNQLPPLYVGTLIADDRGIEQLYRKFQIIQLQENDRRGLNTT